MAESIRQATRSRITTAAEVRSLTGYTSVSDASDADVEAIIDRAQVRVLRAVSTLVHRLRLEGERDGSNVDYMVPLSQSLRVIMDDTFNLTTDGSDVLVELRTDPTGTGVPTWASATVSSIVADKGIITLSSAPADTVDAVELTAYMLKRPIDQHALKEAVEWLSCAMLDKRVREAGKLTLANPDAQRKDSITRDGTSYHAEYRRALRTLMPLAGRDASVDTRISGGI